MLTKKFFCPVNGWDCPYWRKGGSCSMVDDGDDPVMECDDAASFWGEDKDVFVWEDEHGNRYDVEELLLQGYHFINGEPVKPMELCDDAFLDFARDKFNEEEWQRVCDLLAE